MDYIPINPMRTKSGAISVLTRVFGEEDAQPTPLKNRKSALNNFKVFTDAISVRLAASLGLASIFKSSLDANDKGFYFDAMTYTDEEEQRPGKIITATRWGVGIRVSLRVYDIKGNASLNFGMVGAAVDLQLAQAQYEITGVGIGIEGLVIVLGEIPAIGKFDYETCYKLNHGVITKLGQHIKDNKTTLEPQPVGVATIEPLLLLDNARAIYFAVQSVAQGRSLSVALVKAGSQYDSEVIRGVYQSFTQNPDKLTKDESRKAAEWLSY